MNLKTKLIAGFAFAAAIALLAVSFMGYSHAKEHILSGLNSEMSLVLEARVQKLDGWLQGKAKVLETTTAVIQNTVGEANVTQAYLQTYRQDKDLTDLYVGLADGRFIDGSGFIAPPDFDPRKRRWYQQAVEAGKLVFSDPYIDTSTKQYVVSAAQPLMQGGQVRGVAGEDILLTTLAEAIKGVSFNGKGYAFIIDRNGIVLAHPDAKMITTNLLDNQALKDMTRSMLTQEIGNQRYQFQGENKLMIFRKVPSTGWVMAVTINEEDAYVGLAALRWRFILVDIVGILAIAAFAWFFAQRITKPIQQLTANAEQMANGNLTVKAVINGKDEVAVLGLAFNKMGDNLRQLIHSINTSASQVGAAVQEMQISAGEAGRVSEQIAVTISDLAQGATDQAQSVQTGAAMVAGMTKAVEAIDKDVTATVSQTDNVKNAIIHGLAAVTKQADLMNDSSRASANVGQAISTLAEKSNTIGQIVEVISGIAGQTNLLALNAAIEAARAGEQGRGFAVVAEEVRKLAEQSAASSQEITNLIREIQAGTENAVREMAEASAIVTNQQTAVDQTKAAFDEIQYAVEAIVTQIQRVAAETQKLNNQAGEVSAVITDIAAISEESAASSEEVAASTQEQTAAIQAISQEADKLLQEADKLKQAIQKFSI
ncbi:MAG: methyl-accepting chemotaxis protein [Negativicutes bacterium]|nr:methyl-accepting chemotaxis protein [Negativicutes bacterium]